MTDSHSAAELLDPADPFARQEQTFPKLGAEMTATVAAFGQEDGRGLKEVAMSESCAHLDSIREVTPSARGCEECLKAGSRWVHLRLCRTCGHVGCCDDSPNKHATKHFHATRHPIIEGYDPPEGWGWCYVDEVFIDLGTDTTPQLGPIPRYV